jgi:hypothetical protein
MTETRLASGATQHVGLIAQCDSDRRRPSRRFASANQNSVVLSPHHRTEAPFNDREPQKVKVNGSPDIRIWCNPLKWQDALFSFPCA